MVDPQVKGAAVLTDTDALAELLATTGETLLRRPYLRWKPGTSCIAALELASGPAYAAAFSAAAGESWPRPSSRRRPDPCCWPIRSSASSWPGPRRTGISRLCATWRAPWLVLSATILGARSVESDPSDAVQTLAYKPLRRWVGTLSIGAATERATSSGPIGGGTWSGPGRGLKTARKLLGRLAPEPAGHSRTLGAHGAGVGARRAAGSGPGGAARSGRHAADRRPHSSPACTSTSLRAPLLASPAHRRMPPPNCSERSTRTSGRWAAHLAARLDRCRPEDDRARLRARRLLRRPGRARPGRARLPGLGPRRNRNGRGRPGQHAGRRP